MSNRQKFRESTTIFQIEHLLLSICSLNGRIESKLSNHTKYLPEVWHYLIEIGRPLD